MAAARAPADGYTLTMGTNATHGVNQFLYTNIGFDPEKDFEPIILTGTFPMVISASPTAPDQLDCRSGSNGQGKAEIGRHRSAEHDGASRIRVSERTQQCTAVWSSVQRIEQR